MLFSSASKANSMQVLIGQRELLLRNSLLCQGSLRSSVRAISALSSQPACGNSKSGNLYIVGLRGYQKKSSVHFNSRNSSCFKPMAASGSSSVFGDIHVDDSKSSYGTASGFAKPSGVYFGDRVLRSCQKASMSLRNKDPTDTNVVYGYFMFDSVRRKHNSDPITRSWLTGFRISSAASYSSGAAPDISLGGSSSPEQPVDSAALSDRPTLGDRTMKLLSGSCYLPHPDKEETGGEDAHFICVDEQAIGVADGVGGWADVGVNAGLFARELMSHSVNAIHEEPKGSVDPSRVLEKAHSFTKAKGSSTACIIALTSQGLNAINLGDSGFIVVRDGCTIFESPVQQHGFNFTYQLECGFNGDLPSSGQVFTIPVAPGDVIVAGTDGLFDNLYNNEVTAVVVHAVRSGLEPQAAAQKIAALARQRALDKNRQTPFSTAAQEAGFRYYGGKLDDITVVVSYITSSDS